jgi:type VI secretion system secreted protein Hcp
MNKPKLLTALLASTVVALAGAGSAQAATDYFLKVEPSSGDQPIIGESLDREYAKTVQLDSFSFSAENTATIGSATSGAGAGKAQFNELTVTKAVDSTTPQFFQRLAQGRHFASLEIIARNAGATGQAAVPVRYLFQTVFVKSQEQSGDTGNDKPTEKLTFVYGALAQAAQKQTPTGTLGTFSFGNWSIMTNTQIGGLPVGYR